MSQAVEKIRWNIERRLEFIEFRLYWDERVNRSDLVDFFNISIPQASTDLGRYQEMAPQNLEYDRRLKTYVSSAEFQPVLLSPDAQQYLAQLRMIANGIMGEQESWIGKLPPYDAIPTIGRRVDPSKLRKILDVIRTRSAMHVEYQSLSRPEPKWRWLSPHALAFDGHRWHVRAWCHSRNNYQDFVIARMLQIAAYKPCEVSLDEDTEWDTMVTMRIGPNPNLQAAARKAIELDYGMENGELAITTRLCLSFYLERRLGLDLDPEVVEAVRQQIVLLNREEIESIRLDVKSRRKYKANTSEKSLS